MQFHADAYRIYENRVDETTLWLSLGERVSGFGDLAFKAVAAAILKPPPPPRL